MFDRMWYINKFTCGGFGIVKYNRDCALQIKVADIAIMVTTAKNISLRTSHSNKINFKTVEKSTTIFPERRPQLQIFINFITALSKIIFEK